jgi:hypothetical protein
LYRSPWVFTSNDAVKGTNGNFPEKVINKQFIPNVLLPHKLEHGLPIILFLKIKIFFFVIFY